MNRNVGSFRVFLSVIVSACQRGKGSQRRSLSSHQRLTTQNATNVIATSHRASDELGHALTVNLHAFSLELAYRVHCIGI